MLHAIRRQLAGWLDPGLETRVATLGISPRHDPEGAFASFSGRPTAAGVKVNAGTALGIAAFWSGVNLYASTIAALDLEVGVQDRRDGFSPAWDDPRYDLLAARPNRVIPRFNFWQAIVCHALTHKAGYAEIEWSSRGLRPLGLHLMDPRSVEPVMADDRTLRYRIDAKTDDYLDSADVIHIRGLGFDGVNGYSIVEMAAETLGVARAQLVYEGAIYGNGAQKGGHLEIPGDMSPKQQDDQRKAWNDIHQGPGNAGKVGILKGGMKWVDTTYSPADAVMVEAQKAKAFEIARLLRVPPHMIGLMEGATVGNAEEQAQQFVKFSLLPWLKSIEGELNLKLFSPQERRRGLCTRHDTRTLERGNMAARTAYYSARFNLGSITPNEIRMAEGEKPFGLPAADGAYIGTNNLTALRFVDGKPTQPANNKPSPEPKPDVDDQEDQDRPADGA